MATKNLRFDTEEILNDLIPLPKGKQLYPFQEEAVKKSLQFLLTNETNSCYNACEQGLGKTIQTAAVINSLSARKILIICPAVMKYTWLKELNEWLTFIDKSFTVIANTKPKELKKLEESTSIVINYDLVWRDKIFEILIKKKFDIMICDEAHMLKNRMAKRSKAVLQGVWDNATYKICLSGTPFLTNVVDGYSLFNKMAPKLFRTFGDFVSRYSYSKFNGFATVYYGIRNPKDLGKLLRDNFFFRYKKKDVLKDLPDKVYTKILLPSSLSINPPDDKEVQKVVDAIKQDKKIIVPESISKHRRMQGEAKVAEIIAFTLSLLEQNLPVVLFAYHQNVIAKLKEGLKEHNPVVVVGSTKPEDRFKAVEAFQGKETNLFIGNLIAAGTGITLTRSSNVVLGELDFVPSNIAQATSRCHRIGTKDVVNIYYLVVQGSLDEAMADIILQRARDFDKVLTEE